MHSNSKLPIKGSTHQVAIKMQFTNAQSSNINILSAVPQVEVNNLHNHMAEWQNGRMGHNGSVSQ